MDNGRDTRTSATLLGRLRRQPLDQAAWSEFVERYGRKIYHWCRRWHLQPADAEDVTQEVLAKLARKMGSFTYDPSGSFRSWLKTVTHNAWSDFLQSRKVPGAGNGTACPVELLKADAAGTDLIDQLEGAFQRELLEEAMARVRPRVEPGTWEAFRLMAVEGWSGAEVARRLQLKVAHVFVAAGRVRKRLQEEVRKLENGW